MAMSINPKPFCQTATLGFLLRGHNLSIVKRMLLAIQCCRSKVALDRELRPLKESAQSEDRSAFEGIEIHKR